jgi:transcription antitermination factor NusG
VLAGVGNGEQMAWACFQTYGAQERKAVENLTRQGLDAFCPFYTKPVLPSIRARGPKDAPLFPCYGFVYLEDKTQWGIPGNTYGVIRLLTGNKLDPRPLWVATTYIETIYEIQAKFGGNVLPVDTIVRVKTKDSPFFDQIGTVISMNSNDRIRLLMSLFNRDIIVEFEAGADLEIVELE